MNHFNPGTGAWAPGLGARAKQLGPSLSVCLEFHGRRAAHPACKPGEAYFALMGAAAMCTGEWEEVLGVLETARSETAGAVPAVGLPPEPPRRAALEPALPPLSARGGPPVWQPGRQLCVRGGGVRPRDVDAGIVSEPPCVAAGWAAVAALALPAVAA